MTKRLHGLPYIFTAHFSHHPLPVFFFIGSVARTPLHAEQTQQAMSGRRHLSRGSISSLDVYSHTPLQCQVLTGSRVLQVSCGSRHTLAVVEGGEAYSWGWGACGQVRRVFVLRSSRWGLHSQPVGYFSQEFPTGVAGQLRTSFCAQTHTAKCVSPPPESYSGVSIGIINVCMCDKCFCRCWWGRGSFTFPPLPTSIEAKGTYELFPPAIFFI